MRAEILTMEYGTGRRIGDVLRDFGKIGHVFLEFGFFLPPETEKSGHGNEDDDDDGECGENFRRHGSEVRFFLLGSIPFFRLNSRLVRDFDITKRVMEYASADGVSKP